MPLRSEILACRMGPNSAKAATVGDYFLAMSRKLWVVGENFSGKRPLGRKDWRYEVIDALLTAGLASTASEASDLIAKALNPVVDDSDLPDSLQGKTAPAWWNSTDDPFEDQFVIDAPMAPGTDCCSGACDCDVRL